MDNQRTLKTESVKDIIGRLYVAPGCGKRGKFSREYCQHLIISQWEKIVSPEIASHARPNYFSGDTLIIAATPVWASQLGFFRRPLIDAANRYVAREIVKDIRLTAALTPGERRKAGAGREENISPAAAEIKAAAKLKLKPLRPFAAQKADERLERKIEAANAARHARQLELAAHGAQRCAGGCGAIVAAGEKYCAVCEGSRRRAHYERIREKIVACPWAGYEEINNYEPCRPAEANRIRRELLRRQAERVEYRAGSDKDAPLDSYDLEEIVLVMLYRSLPLEKITPPLMAKTLYELRYDLKNAPPRPLKNLKEINGRKTIKKINTQ